MPRSGGESDKLGNRYEGLWTVGRLLEVAAGEIDAITIEPFGDESQGIEFVAADEFLRTSGISLGQAAAGQRRMVAAAWPSEIPDVRILQSDELDPL